MAWWKILAGIWIMIGGVVGMAQTVSRDYAVSLPIVSYAADGTTATVAFTVTNEGGAAAEETQINIAQNSDNRVIRSAMLPPLAAGEDTALAFAFNLAELPVDDPFFRVEVGIDQYELAGSPIAINNSQLFRVSASEAAAAADSPRPVPASPAAAVYDLWLPLINVGINIDAAGITLNSSRVTLSQILTGLALFVAGLFLLWLLSLILRLLLYPTPKFGIWHPPYAVSVYHDPDSTEGRRQSWQPHAQNSVISAPCRPDHVAVIKRLLDTEGAVLGSWKIKAIRTVQYDMYGNINRTEVVMSAQLTRRLNKVVRQAPRYDSQQLYHALKRIAKQLGKAALKPVSKQNMALPIALDFRFEGVYGEVAIVFELYQCLDAAWHLIDQWQPELGMAGANIPESFTYTLQGLLPGETPKAYRHRLQEDLARLLAGLLHQHQSAPANDDGEEASLADLLDDSAPTPETDTDDSHSPLSTA